MTGKQSKRRRSSRLTGYDYTLPGAYFVTICAYKMRRIFGEIIEEGISHSDVGIIVEDELQMTDVLRPEIRLDQFVIMPNHVHAIILIELGPIGPIAVGAHRDAPLHRSARS